MIASVICTFIISTIYVSFFEWTFHRYMLHAPVRFFRWAYRSHGGVHHSICRADATFHIHDGAPTHHLSFPLWSGISLVILGNCPFVVLAIFLSCWLIPTVSFINFLCYYLTLDYLHWCMHRPNGRLLEKTAWFRFLKNHHRLHHLMPRRNLNVLIPLADWAFGTLLLDRPEPPIP